MQDFFSSSIEMNGPPYWTLGAVSDLSSVCVCGCGCTVRSRGASVPALRFNVGVRVAVDIHGCQVGAAFDAHAQPATSPLLGLALDVAVGGRGEVLQAEQQAASLLQTSLLFSLPLRLTTEAGREKG